jgi:hypothetical protein
MILQTLYVVDFFCNEAWYTHTVDISHDHFGFMLAWGDTAFLPAFYTLQAQYLSRHEGVMSPARNLALLGLGLTSYVAFRAANHQRHRVRRQFIAGLSTPIAQRRLCTAGTSPRMAKSTKRSCWPPGGGAWQGTPITWRT